MGSKTLTTANSTLHLQIAGLYPVPQAIQGYAADDMFSLDAIEPAEVLMGVDGKMSAGFVAKEAKFNFVLQGDSDSNDILDNLIAAQKAEREIYFINGTMSLQGTGDKFAMTRGVLTSYQPIADAKKILQPRKYTITFQSIDKSPI